MIDKNKIKRIYDSRFMRLYDIEHREGKHYYVASRRAPERLLATTPDKDWKNVMADAVSCAVVLYIKGEEPRLLLNWEYRYPVGQYLLSVPAGLIDEEDWDNPNALEDTAKRELEEETGIVCTDQDKITILNPLVFSTPGMTDEANALVGIAIHRDKMPSMNQNGAEETESFDGFRLLTKKEAAEHLSRGTDEHGMYYPLYTWMALMCFVSGLV
ncbi:MAG: NUDIX hydrolase [Eubacteriales bacterium]|nr:NUDIX hydrolase [Eubacteriales bacterium]